MKHLNKILVLSFSFLLTGCLSNISFSSSEMNSYSSFESFSNEESNTSISKNDSTSSSKKEDKASSSTVSHVSSTSVSKENSTSNSTTSNTSTSIINSNDFIRKITGAGSYTLSGEINGSILVEALDTEDVELVLDNVTLISSFNSPIYIKSANEVKIKLAAGSTNYIKDNRPEIDENNEDANQGKGTIYAKCDLKFTGTGSLKIEANYNNGIHSSDDIKFKNTSSNDSKIEILAFNHAVKGNDSITVESGKLIANSKCGSGLKSENTSISNKGNQKGNIDILGGDIEINSCEDAIEAGYNVNISNNPSIKITTSKFSSYTLGSSSTPAQTTKMYLRTTNTNYDFAVSFRLDNGQYSWVNANYFGSKQGGRGTTYYLYDLAKPNNAVAMKVYSYRYGTTNKTETNATASFSTYVNINSNYDTMVLSTSSSSVSYSSWTSYASMGGSRPGFDGNSNKVDYSAKGIKANNNVNIEGGNINIKSYDDGLNASYGNALENGETSQGIVNVRGGNIVIYSTDDGIHGDNTVNIMGGNIDIQNSYEGVESNFINIEGGYTKIYSTDDGLNAAKKIGQNPAITVTGGVLDITVYGGDVDGIDSNNTYTQRGGVVITKGGTGGMSTGLDTDGITKIESGTLIVFGKPENTPSLGTGVSSYTLSGSYSIGNYKVANQDNSYEVSTKYSYTAIYVYSSEISRYTVTKL